MPLIDRWMPSTTRSSPVAGAMALQQLDLQMIERVEIGKSVADRAREQRIAVEQACPDRRSPRSLAMELSHSRRMRGKIASRRATSSTSLAYCDAIAMLLLASTMSMLEIMRLEERPLAIHFLQQRQPVLGMALKPSFDRGAEAIPARQHQPALRPAEHPGNGAQILDPA